MTPPNPFHFGSPAAAPYFCDRDEEVAGIVARMSAGIHVFVLGPRRFGKSSIVLRAAQAFRKGGGAVGYADLIRCTSELEVATEMLNAVVNGVLSGSRRAARRVEDVLEHLRVAPTVSIDPSGTVTFGFDPAIAQRSWNVVFDDALSLLETAAKRGPTALALDEFQRVADVGKSGMGGAFKAAADRLTHCSLVLAGSHASVMEKLTRAKGAPLYGMGELFSVGAIEKETMLTYLVGRARAAKKQLSTATAAHVYERAGGVPNDVQWLAFSAFAEAAGKSEISVDDVEAAMATIVRRQASSFAERFESLAVSRQRVLKELSVRPTKSPFAKAFLDQIGVANVNSVRVALRVLSDLELVVRREGTWEVASPFFKDWLAGG